MLAPAKINLMLHVTGKRADGYHLLQSMVAFADSGDELALTPAETLELTVDGPFAPALGHDNLIITAAHALANHASMRPHGRFTLRKNLPVGAGLGGGSSDAAAALQLLNDAWKLGMSYDELFPIAASLGSDVPACLLASPCCMEDTGHVLTPLAIDCDMPMLLVNPQKPVATQDVYRKLAPPYDAPITLPRHFRNPPELLAFLHRTHNALEAPAIGLEPVIGHVLDHVRAAAGCRLARMSGSGGTCFGLFDDMAACHNAANQLRGLRADWWVQPTMLRGNHG